MTLVIINPTGYAPIGVEVTHDAYFSHQSLEGDKRGVSLSLWPAASGGWVAELQYRTTWGSERSFTRFYEADDLDSMGFTIRAAAKTIMPPGAGYPATPQYETRQAKLQGMLETLTLVALSDVLQQIAD